MKDSKDEAGPYWSLMFEVSESYCKPVNQKSIKLAGKEWPEIVKETIIGALNTKLVSADDQIVSIYHRYVRPVCLSGVYMVNGTCSTSLGCCLHIWLACTLCVSCRRCACCVYLTVRSCASWILQAMLQVVGACAFFCLSLTAMHTLVLRPKTCPYNVAEYLAGGWNMATLHQVWGVKESL